MTARDERDHDDDGTMLDADALIAQYRGNIDTAVSMLMRRSGIYKKQLAAAIEVSDWVLSRRFMTSSDHVDWNVEELAKVCAYFGVDLVDLLEPWRLNEKPTKVVTSGGKRYFPTTAEARPRLVAVR